MLPIFDLTAEIEKYNQTHPNDKCDLSEDFNCDHFKNGMLKITNDVTDSINNGHEGGWFSEEEQAILSHQHALLQELQCSFQQANNVLRSESQQLRQNPHYKSLVKNMAYVEWQKRMLLYLDNPTLWENWLKQPEVHNKPLIKKLRDKLGLLQLFSCWHPDTVLKVSNEILPDLRQYHKLLLSRSWRL